MEKLCAWLALLIALLLTLMGAPAEAAPADTEVSAAANGTGTSAAQTLHRIEKAAGFVYEGESPVLADPADDHSKGVFDDSIRGRADQFVLRFREPKG